MPVKPSDANGHEFVDLGLSVMWATTNIGAARPESYGNYYAWGETETKSEYRKDNYYIWAGSDLTPSYDAAYVNWGGNWRIPTKAEFEELRDRCSWEYMKISGTPGFDVKGPNGNSIFLPMPGYLFDTYIDDIGIIGTYWSSEQKSDYSSQAYVIDIYNDGDISLFANSRYYGLSIRPVLP